MGCRGRQRKRGLSAIYFLRGSLLLLYTASCVANVAWQESREIEGVFIFILFYWRSLDRGLMETNRLICRSFQGGGEDREVNLKGSYYFLFCKMRRFFIFCG